VVFIKMRVKAKNGFFDNRFASGFYEKTERLINAPPFFYGCDLSESFSTTSV